MLFILCFFPPAIESDKKRCKTSFQCFLLGKRTPLYNQRMKMLLLQMHDGGRVDMCTSNKRVAKYSSPGMKLVLPWLLSTKSKIGFFSWTLLWQKKISVAIASLWCSPQMNATFIISEHHSLYFRYLTKKPFQKNPLTSRKGNWNCIKKIKTYVNDLGLTPVALCWEFLLL